MINYYLQRELSQTFSLPPLNLHINQILVDNSDGEMDLAVLEGITLSLSVSSHTHSLSPLSPGPELSLSLAAKLLVECIKIRDAERARLAIWWKQKLHVHFYDVFMLSRLFLMWPVRAAWDLERAGRELWCVYKHVCWRGGLIWPVYVQYGLVGVTYV